MALGLADAALAAVDGERLVIAAELQRPTAVLAVGKAAAAMARGALSRWPGVPTVVVVTEAGLGDDVPGADVFIGDHPHPGRRSVEATAAARAFLRAQEPGAEILVLVSGGASALFEEPAEGLRITDAAALGTEVMDRGGPIDGLNRLRKAISSTKGGRALRDAPHARWTVAVLSDVPGDDVHLVGSGPFVPPTTEDPADITALFQQWAPASWSNPAVRRAAQRPPPDLGGIEPRVLLLAGRMAAATALRAEAAMRGLGIVSVDTLPSHDAEEAVRHFLDAARAATRGVVRIGRRDRGCGTVGAVWSGEVLVSGTRGGHGGRNQHAALAALADRRMLGGGTLVCLATDGEDGPSGRGGAIVGPAEIDRAAALGIDIHEALRTRRSTPALDALGCSLPGRATGTNSADLWLWLGPNTPAD